MEFNYTFAMPNAFTFQIPQIQTFIQRWWATPSVDPFAGRSEMATWRNDLNPDTPHGHHLDAVAFLEELDRADVRAALALLDPPYSLRQMKEHYNAIGRTVTEDDTQAGALMRNVKDALDRIMAPGGVVLSFGWSGMGMGVNRCYAVREVLMVTHGGMRNATICVAERKEGALPFARRQGGLSDWFEI
jgi:hypothetical protein